MKQPCRRQCSISWLSAFFVAAIMALAGCEAGQNPAGMLLQLPPTESSSPLIALLVDTQPLRQSEAPCEDRFVALDLAHETTIASDVVRMFESNGAGLAVDDLNGDGLLDIVLANLAGSNTILMNQGELDFAAEPLPFGGTRGVNIVDIDGDGNQDLVFARRTLRPLVYMNDGLTADGASVQWLVRH